MSAAEKAMNDIGAALDSYFEGERTERMTMAGIAQIVGAYGVERIGEGE